MSPLRGWVSGRQSGPHVANRRTRASIIITSDNQTGAAGFMRTNAELVRTALEGETSAFAELVRRYERAVWTTGWHVLRDYHAVQDATQNAFVEAFRQPGKL